MDFFVVFSIMPLISVTLVILYFKWKKPVGVAMKIVICVILFAAALLNFQFLRANGLLPSYLFTSQSGGLGSTGGEEIVTEDISVSFGDSYTSWDTNFGDDAFYASLIFTSTEIVTEYGFSCWDLSGESVSGFTGTNPSPPAGGYSFHMATMWPENGEYFGELRFGETYYWAGYVICNGQRYDSPQYSFVFTADGTRFCSNNRDEYNRLLSEMKSGKIDVILTAEVWSYGSLIYNEGFDMNGNITDFRINLFDRDGRLIESLDGSYDEDRDALIAHIALYTSVFEYTDYWCDENGEMAYYVLNWADNNGEILYAEFYSPNETPPENRQTIDVTGHDDISVPLLEVLFLKVFENGKIEHWEIVESSNADCVLILSVSGNTFTIVGSETGYQKLQVWDETGNDVTLIIRVVS